MRTILKVLLSAALSDIAASAVGFFYGVLAIVPQLEASTAHAYYRWAAAGATASYVLIPAPLFVCMLPVGRALDALTAGRPLAAEVLTRARRRALQLPILVAAVSFGGWLVAAVSLPVVFGAAAAAAPPEAGGAALLTRAVLSMLIVGSLGAGMAYATVDWWLRCRIVPALFPDGRLADLEQVATLSLRWRMLLIAVDTSLLPAVTLVTLAYLGDSPSALALVGFAFFALGVFQIWFISSSVTEPVVAVARGMDEVSEGRHDVRVVVPAADDIGRLTAGFNHMAASLKRAEFVKDTFGRYVTRQVLRREGRPARAARRLVAASCLREEPTLIALRGDFGL